MPWDPQGPRPLQDGIESDQASVWRPLQSIPQYAGDRATWKTPLSTVCIGGVGLMCPQALENISENLSVVLNRGALASEGVVIVCCCRRMSTI